MLIKVIGNMKKMRHKVILYMNYIIKYNMKINDFGKADIFLN